MREDIKILIWLAGVAVILFGYMVFSVASASAYETIQENTAGIANYNDFGKATTTMTSKIAIKYRPAQDSFICGIYSKIFRKNTPTDNLIMRFYAGGTDPENGTLIFQSGGFAGADLPATMASASYLDFSPANCISNAGGGIYWLTFTRTGALSDTNHYERVYLTDNTYLNNNLEFCSYATTGGWTCSNNTNEQSLLLTGIGDGVFFTAPVASPSFENQDFGILGNYLRDVIVWLFWPSESSLNQYANLADSVQNKPPFGYFVAIKDSFNGLENGTSSISLPIEPIEPLITPIRSAFIWIFWLAFGFYLLKRFIHFDL